MTAFLVLDRLDKRFGGLHVTREVSLSVAKSEILVLLGPSGSGKTTVLRTIAGLEAPDSGRVLVESEDVTSLPPERRRFGVVFQHYALFPHMTVAGNVGFGLESSGVRGNELRGRIAEALAAVDLSGFEGRKVTEISGGQQQRVALARALAPRPRVLLLDEPLSNLDPTLRGRTRRELKRIIRDVGITTVFVTHEQEEAFELGDRVALMNAGALEQVGVPRELYESPATRFAAGFIGRSSVVDGRWEKASGRVRLSGGAAWPATADWDLLDGSPVEVVVRPEAIGFSTARDGMAAEGRVVEPRFAGRETYWAVALEGG
ncbi:MAG TPA: ABC transporter ATP-binding protein, partial [Thermoanaerobaculia bacterium]|nr:ABC transporter ATP-binding protein [Thermoanaerobaculia bacterium]